MDTLAESVAQQKIWQAWILKGRLRDQKQARKFRNIALTALGLLAIGGVYYFAGVR
jgi:hypothetical protein